MQPTIDLSIIILSYKMDGLVKNCLKSIFSHEYTSTLEVIVVDNGSNDNCEAMIQKHYPQVKFIQTGANLGYAKGNNVAVAQAKGRYILTLNPDTICLQPIFDQWIAYMDQHQNIGISSVQLRNPDGSLQPGAWRFLRWHTPIYQRIPLLASTSWGKRYSQEYLMADWDRQQSRQVDWVQGSCLLIRREALDDIGHKDERFFLYFTDVDWCRRCWEQGWQVYYFAELSVIHYYHRESATRFALLGLLNKTTRIHVRDWFQYLRKYWPNIFINPTK